MSEQAFILSFLALVIGLAFAFGLGADLFRRWLKLKEKRLDHAALLAADKAAAQTAHIERLEQRMRVLERIATDKGAALAEEIETLSSSAAQAPRLADRAN